MKKNISSLKNYRNLKVLVTGSTGFKGAWLCNWLILLGSKVIGVGLKPEKESIIFDALKINKKVSQYFVDIKNFDRINRIIKKEKPDIIFHLAAQSIVSYSFINPLETFGTNVIGSANILESVKINKIPNLVYITSDKCYLNLDKKVSYKESDILGGLDNYSSSKASEELLFKSYFHSYFRKNYISIATARAGNVIGGGDFKKDRIVPDVIKSLQSNKVVFIRNPNATRPWQHILEPLSGYLILGEKLINKKLNSKIIPNWNFGPNRKNCKKVKFIVQSLINEWGEKNHKIIIKKSKNFHESKLLSLNIDKAKKELSWKPNLTLNETIEFTVDWYKSFFTGNDVEDLSNQQINYYSHK